MPAKKTAITVDPTPEKPTIGKRPVILSLYNPYPGDPTQVIRPKQGLGMPPANTSDSFSTSNVTFPTSGLGVPPGALLAPTPIPGRIPTKVHVPKKKKAKKEDKPNKKDKETTSSPAPSSS